MEYKKTYKNLFDRDSRYNVHVEDKHRYDFVLNEIMSKGYNNMIDISSGRGFLLKYVREIKSEMVITSTDLMKFNDLDVNFIELDLTKVEQYERVNGTYQMLSCLDVLEHVEEKYVDDILSFFASKADSFCFSIANHPDIINGIELHLIQKDMGWWNDKLNKYFTITNSFSVYGDRLFCYVLSRK